MTGYNPRETRVRDDNSGSWIIGIIVLVAIGIGVWWWAGWGTDKPQSKGAAKPICNIESSTTGVYWVEPCDYTSIGQQKALGEFIQTHPDRRIVSFSVNRVSSLLIITEPK